MNENVTVNEAGMALITKGQNPFLRPQRQADGRILIGYGHTLKGEEANTFKSITQEQADEFLKEDVKAIAHLIREEVVVSLNANQFSALASFALNIGEENFCRSTLLRWLNEERFRDVPGELLRWHRIGPDKSPSPELIRRRTEEALLFLRTS